MIITQLYSANPTKVAAIEALLGRMPFGHTRQANEGRNFVMNSKSLHALVLALGHRCWEKRVPEFLFEVKPEYRRRFLHAYALGDAWRQKSGSWVYTTTSPGMADDLERLLLGLGRSCTRGNPWMGKRRNGEPSRLAYRVNELTRDVAEVQPQTQKKVEYSGAVYCATVPGSLLLTRRGFGAKPLWSGNSVGADQFGFIDPIAGPECLLGDSEVETARGWVRWDAVTNSDLFRCLVDFDHTQFLPASRIVVRAHTTELICAKTDEISMKVTPRHRIVEVRRVVRVLRNDADVDVVKSWAMHVTTAQQAFGWSRQFPSLDLKHGYGISPDQWYTEKFNGRVYCATVPGGCLFVRGTPDSAGYWTGNSERAGIDVRLATGARIGSDGRIYQLMRNRRTGKNQWVSPTDLVGKTLKLPD